MQWQVRIIIQLRFVCGRALKVSVLKRNYLSLVFGPEKEKLRCWMKVHNEVHNYVLQKI